MEMSGQRWTPEFVTNPTNMPMGRLPVAKLGDRLVPDSNQIRALLEQQGADFDAGLSASDKAQSHAIIRMVEESLRHGLVYDRWMDDRCWPHFCQLFFSEIPSVVRGFITKGIRKKIHAKLIGHGIAQFSEEERLTILKQDLDALEQTLGDKQFLFADHPTAADASAAPVLSMIASLPEATKLRELVRNNPVLMGYVARSKQAIFPK